ncbi:hypothetical protein HN385_03445 [archaeon]|jgi:hypothetical protein|nr:hypothetical protein [archaeon]MBT3450686.1 hypothetical protein [archaeon]MBT6869751.1 hypothetical protein [archaeon]MBT7192706.1 hypothetical protein [archaeon]MBT7380731.1 hypothetical protein [archaeon]
MSSLDDFLNDCFKYSIRRINVPIASKKKLRRELKPKYDEVISQYSNFNNLDSDQIPNIPLTCIASHFERSRNRVTHKEDFKALCHILSQNQVKDFVSENYPHSRTTGFLHSVTSIYLSMAKYVGQGNQDYKELNLDFIGPATELFKDLNHHDNILYMLSMSFEELSELITCPKLAKDLFKTLFSFKDLVSFVPLVNELSSGLSKRSFNFHEDFKKRLILIRKNNDLIKKTVIPYESSDCFNSPSNDVMKAIGSVIAFENDYFVKQTCNVFEGNNIINYKPNKARAFHYHNIKHYKDREILKLIKLSQAVNDWENWDPNVIKFYIKNINFKDQDLEYNLPIRVINNLVKAYQVSYNYMFSPTKRSKNGKRTRMFGFDFSEQFCAYLDSAASLGNTQKEKVMMINAWSIDTYRLIKDPNSYQINYGNGMTEMQKINQRLIGVAV